MNHLKIFEEIKKLPRIKQRLIQNMLNKHLSWPDNKLTLPRYDDLYYKFEKQFSENEGIKPLDQKYEKIINDNLWDLIG